MRTTRTTGETSDARDRAGITDEEIARWVWAGDDDSLRAHLPCKCCCDEHTSRRCPARRWFGCVGQFGDHDRFDDPDHDESWARFYARARGMTREQFFEHLAA